MLHVDPYGFIRHGLTLKATQLSLFGQTDPRFESKHPRREHGHFTAKPAASKPVVVVSVQSAERLARG